MRLSDLFNFPLSTEIDDSGPPSPGGLKPTGARATPPQGLKTGSTFITPQVLAAYPLAAGIVAGFWKAGQRLFHLTDDSFWLCFAIAMVIAFFSYVVSVTDPKLQATRRDKLVGFGFAVLNGIYLFTTAIGISTVVKK